MRVIILLDEVRDALEMKALRVRHPIVLARQSRKGAEADFETI
jgi:hypothetical protein